ncbi:MAG: biosynthetic-type acetolactate synthase large subunit [Candidatus Bathyarchaeia archaeon]|nr:biosynthetic-type acetolactate synthase large subunit [Candidatus Bathyarchaeota archaeon]
MTRMSGAEAFVKALKREGVETIFGLPGGAILPICDALYDSDIRFILARHEQGAAHMADGYARASGRVGVCLATSGPGATNLVTGIATANIDSSSVVAFTGQVPIPVIGTDAFQEVDIIGVSASVTKYNIQVRGARDIPWAVKAAFYLASTGRKGAVLVDIPKDVQTSVEDMEFPEKVSFRGYRVQEEPDPRELDWASVLLSRAKRPMILAGGGVISSNASRELIALAEALMAPVATSLMGKGAVPNDHPLYVGGCGMHGTGEANTLLAEADVLLVVGARLSDRTTGLVKEFSPNAKVIHVDIDRSEIDKNVETVTRVVGDAKLALTGLLERLRRIRLEASGDSEWVRRINELRELYIMPEAKGNPHMRGPEVMRALRRSLPRDAIITTEVGQCQMWASLYFDSYAPRTFLTSGGLGTMGWGFPAAIGAKAARRDVPVVDIAGDGSFAMTENNLATSVEEELPVIVVILNNRMLGMVAQWQRLFYGRRYFGVELGKAPDFVKLAEAYGAVGVRPESLEELEREIRRAIEADQTTVIDVPIDPEENVFPMVPPGKGLKEFIMEA